jgi:XTP/dITP diphosphohydrolase
MEPSYLRQFERLKVIMDELREQCPWDRKQTVASLRQMTIEETFELADAITNMNWQGIREELGDILLHVLFYAKIGDEQGQFTLEETIRGICDKLIARHPHIYGDVQVRDDEDVKRNWEKLKLREGKASVLSGVPRALPAMVKAMRLQEKARQVGFEWDHIGQVWEKVQEETAELQEAIADREQDGHSSNAQQRVEDEFGDLLFSLVNYSRFLGLDAENALERTNQKFIQRFRRMEARAAEKGMALHDMSLADMDKIWNDIKKEDRV